MIRGTFQTKDPAEQVSLPFDISADLGGATIASTTLSVTLDAGTDADPSAVLNGSATIDGGIAYVPVKGGAHMADYVVACTFTLSDGRVLVLAGLLPVRNA